MQYALPEDGQFSCEILAEHDLGAMQAPVNFLVVDATGSGLHESFDLD